MKFLLLLVLALIVMWLWRSNRQSNTSEDKPPASSSPPQEMVGCQLCAVHIPRSEALVGDKGVYCCAEHRQRMES